MHNYTMTFKYDGEFDLPEDEEVRKKEVQEMVLGKLENHEFELIDFNLTENYDGEQSKLYIHDPLLHRAVLEIRLDLSIKEMKSREAIYAKCLKALKEDELCLAHTYGNDDKEKGMLQSIIVFEMKQRQRAQA